MEFHLTSTQPTMEVNYASSVVVRVDLPSPPLGLIGLSTTIPLHNVRYISQATQYMCMWGKGQLTSSIFMFLLSSLWELRILGLFWAVSIIKIMSGLVILIKNNK